jgi:hypothetical protein
MQTDRKGKRPGTIGPDRTNALERIMEKFHGTIPFTFQN